MTAPPSDPLIPLVFLALHTTSSQLQLALGCEGNYRYSSWYLGRDLGRYLHTHLQEIMGGTSWQSLKGIAVHTGTGSQTGMRIGLTVGITLAQQLAIPLFAIAKATTALELMAIAEQQYRQGHRPSWQSAIASLSSISSTNQGVVC